MYLLENTKHELALAVAVTDVDRVDMSMERIQAERETNSCSVDEDHSDIDLRFDSYVGSMVCLFVLIVCC